MRTRTVLVWTDLPQFEMACQVLEEAGLPFERHGRGIDSLDDPGCALPTNLLELRVPEQDFERARCLLVETVGRGVVKG